MSLIQTEEDLRKIEHEFTEEGQIVFESVLRDFVRHSEFLSLVNLNEKQYTKRLRAVMGYFGSKGWPFKGLLYAAEQHRAYRHMAFLTFGKCYWCGVWLASVQHDDYFLTGFFDYRYCSDICKQNHIASK